MPLIDLKTNLKSLRYGNDRFGGGSSNQPYITKEIPEGQIDFFGGDLLVRGGALLPQRIVDDVSRLTQLLTDLKNPRGSFFTIKQNLLIDTAPPHKIKAYNKDVRLEQKRGIYTPLDTLANAGGIALGIHFKSPGPDLNFNGGYYDNQYYDVVRNRNFLLSNNRLVNIYNENISKDFTQPTLVTLPPQSFASSTPTEADKNSSEYQSSWGKGIPAEGKNGKIKLNYSRKVGASYKYFNITGEDPNKNLFSTDGGLLALRRVYEDGFKATERQFSNNSLTQTQLDLNSNELYRDNPIIKDFRQTLRSNLSVGDKAIYEKNGILTASPSYNDNEKNRYGRLHYRNPADKDRNLSNYTNGTGKGAVDLITASEVGSNFLNDLVKFRIQAINIGKPGKPTTTTNLQFRALINNFNDGYTADWTSTKYVGRGENFWKYSGFDRKISLSWFVVASSKEELIPMYKKLNYLASNLMPDYSEAGFMRGPLIKLTIGGYLVNMPGYISSLRFSVPEQATWEIGINTEGKPDGTVKELPHIIEVSSFEFTPLHDFLPQKVKDPQDQETKFIALSTVGHKPSNNSNYNRENTSIPPEFTLNTLPLTFLT